MDASRVALKKLISTYAEEALSGEGRGMLYRSRSWCSRDWGGFFCRCRGFLVGVSFCRCRSVFLPLSCFSRRRSVFSSLSRCRIFVATQAMRPIAVLLPITSRLSFHTNILDYSGLEAVFYRQFEPFDVALPVLFSIPSLRYIKYKTSNPAYTP